MNRPKRTGPVAFMLVPCEDVLVHPFRQGTFSFINVVDRLITDSLPYRVSRMCFYVRLGLFDGGDFKYRVEIWDQAKKVLECPEQVGQLTDVAAHFNDIVRALDFSLAGEGQHWVKVFVNNEESLRVPIYVRKLEKEKGAPPEEAGKAERHRRERPMRGKKGDREYENVGEGGGYLMH